MARKPGDYIGTAAWQKLRRQRLAWAHYQCECCGAAEELQLDHVFARANGNRGRVTFEEVQILCRRCNQAKGTLEITAAQLRELLGIDPRDPIRTTPWSRRRTVLARPRIG